MYFFQKNTRFLIPFITMSAYQRHRLTALLWLFTGAVLPALIIVPLWWQSTKLTTLITKITKSDTSLPELQDKLKHTEAQVTSLKNELATRAALRKNIPITHFLNQMPGLSGSIPEAAPLKLLLYRPRAKNPKMTPPRLLYELSVEGSLQALVAFLKELTAPGQGYTLESISLPKIPGSATMIIGKHEAASTQEDQKQKDVPTSKLA